MPVRPLVAILSAACSLLGAATAATQGKQGNSTVNPLPPSQDPWYTTPPARMAGIVPGTIAKMRDAPGNLTSSLVNLKEAVQILFHTTNSLGIPTYAVTTVLVPKLPTSPKTDIVSYQIAYDSACLDSSPSYALSTSSDSIRLDILDRMLDRGWFVNIPDYETISASFGAPVVAGAATLDSLAALQSVGMGRLGLAEESIIALFGYSGGASATVYAHLLKVSYGWKFGYNIKGIAMGGLPVRLAKVMERLDGSIASGLIINAISGLMKEYPAIQEQVAMAGKQHGRFNTSAFEEVRHMPFAESMVKFSYHKISDYFNGGIDRVLNKPIRRLLTSRTDIRTEEDHGKPLQMYFWHGIQDEIAPIADMDSVARLMCNRPGRYMQYDRFATGDHLAVGDAGIENAMTFLAELFNTWAEKPVRSNVFLPGEVCKRRTITMESENFGMDSYRRSWKNRL